MTNSSKSNNSKEGYINHICYHNFSINISNKKNKVKNCVKYTTK
jgi:hypothetical protein